MINLKDEILLREIANTPKTLIELSNLINISERSIRYKITNLKNYFKDNNLELDITLKNGKVQLIGNLEKLKNQDIFSKYSTYVFSQEERMEVLINFLYFCEEKFVVQEYLELIDVSESTFKKDWKLLKKTMDSINLKILNRKYFTKIEGNEEKIRNNMLASIIKYKINPRGIFLKNKIIENIIDSYFLSINFNEIDKLLHTFSKRLDVVMSDEAFNIIKFNLGIVLKRTAKNNFINEIKNEEFLKSTDEYREIRDVLSKFNSVFSKDEFIFEVLNITEFLIGSHSYNFKYSFYENWIHMDTIIHKFISKVSDELKINFKEDMELFEGILNHTKPMIYRIKKGIKLENTITSEIKKEFPNILVALKNSIYILEDYIGIKIDENEISYLCIFFRLAEKKYQTTKIPRVVIICNFGYGVSKILEVRLKEKFNIKIVKTLPQNQLDLLEVEKEKIDYVITTTNFLNDRINIPVLAVSPLLNEKDVKLLKERGFQEIKLKDYYDELMQVIDNNCYIRDEKKLKNDISLLLGLRNNLCEKNSFFRDFLTSSKIEVIEKSESIEKAIERAGEILKNEKSIEKEYIKSCVDIFKEQGLYMLIGKNSILPHSDSFENVIKTDYSLLKLKTPILYYLDGNKIEIRNIFLLASKDGKEHRNSLINLKKLIDKYDLENQLEKSNNIEEIIEVFERLSKEEKEENL